MSEQRDEERKKVAEWLNTKGLDIEFDADGFWMEDYRFQDYKTKDIADLMREYSQGIREENAILRAAVKEMEQYLPVLEYVEGDGIGWDFATAGHGIATVNAYRQTLQNALDKINEK